MLPRRRAFPRRYIRDLIVHNFKASIPYPPRWPLYRLACPSHGSGLSISGNTHVVKTYACHTGQNGSVPRAESGGGAGLIGPVAYGNDNVQSQRFRIAQSLERLFRGYRYPMGKGFQSPQDSIDRRFNRVLVLPETKKAARLDCRILPELWPSACLPAPPPRHCTDQWLLHLHCPLCHLSPVDFLNCFSIHSVASRCAPSI